MTSPDPSHDRHVVALLAALRRRRAPQALEGFVVAALQAGVREARAVARVRDLAPRVAPADLGVRVEAGIDRLRAPRTLDTFVRQRLELPGAGLAEACLRRLPLLAAPHDLAARLAERGPSGDVGLEFVPARARGRVAGLGRWLAARRIASAVASILLVSGALLVLGIGGLMGGGRGPSLSDWHHPVRDPARPRAGYEPNVARGEAPRTPISLSFEFDGYSSYKAAPLTVAQRTLLSGISGELMEGGT